MSKSYTLADGSNITVTSTANGVPFNEGMQALTKAIKARVAVRDGSGTGGASGKQEGIITIVNGYGSIVQNNGSTSDGTFTVSSNSGSTIYWHESNKSEVATVSSGDTITTGEHCNEYFFTKADDNFTAGSFYFYSNEWTDKT